ncbi:hypothetical protein A4X13_0g8021, partial [Tilletia indica]
PGPQVTTPQSGRDSQLPVTRLVPRIPYACETTQPFTSGTSRCAVRR